MRKILVPLFLGFVVACDSPVDSGTRVESENVEIGSTNTLKPFRWGHFGAVLPCDDCEKRRLNTMLWSTGSALVRDEHVGTRSGTRLEHHWGKWTRDGDVITISHFDDPIYRFIVKGVDTVQWLASEEIVDLHENDLARQPGTLTPGIEVEVIGLYYAPGANPRVANVRECASGKNFLIRLDPEAADIQSRFEEMDINLAAGVPARMFGRLRPVEMVDEETGADMILFQISNWSEFLPDQNCLQ